MEKNINSVIKALRILECFSREVKELKLSEIAKILKMPKSTVSNLIYTLEKMGYIEQKIQSGKFSIGAKNFIIGKIYEYHLDIVEVAKPFMEALRNKFNENVNLSIPVGNEAICVEKIDGYNEMGMKSQVGKKLPLHCTASGKLFLYALSPEKLDETLQTIDLYKYTDFTISDADTLRKEINANKDNGYSIAIEESEIGLTSIAAPIYDHSGKITAALSIAAPSARLTDDVRQQVIQELITMAKQISVKLGYSQ
jgi:DNA-binding IclR family transcriptional regulator